MIDYSSPSLVSVEEMNAFIGGAFGGNQNACEEMSFAMAVAVMFPSAASLRPGKIISGPTVFSICDAALFYAALSATGMEPMTLTSEMSIRFLRPARGEVIRARATLNSIGSRSIVRPEQASIRLRSSGKCAYRVCRCTPARSATMLKVVDAGPTLECKSTAASTMRCRVSACCCARRFSV